MIVSHDRRFIFLLPWKTASQTILARLDQFNQSKYGRRFEFNPVLKRIVSPHLTRADFECLPESQHGYFTAAFVRNPYDRVYSGFHQLQRDIATHPGVTFSSTMVKSLILEQLREIDNQIKAASSNFDDWVASIKDWQILEQGRNTSFPLYPCHYWTHFDAKSVIDFVGMVETFEDDFRKFCQACDLDSVFQINENISELNPASSRQDIGYRYTDRMSRQSIQTINQLFEKDFELFEYPMIGRS